MKPDPENVVEELEEISDRAKELNPEEDLTWANTPDTDMGIYDYE